MSPCWDAGAGWPGNEFPFQGMQPTLNHPERNLCCTYPPQIADVKRKSAGHRKVNTNRDIINQNGRTL